MPSEYGTSVSLSKKNNSYLKADVNHCNSDAVHKFIPVSLIKGQHSVHGHLRMGNQLINATSLEVVLSQAV